MAKSSVSSKNKKQPSKLRKLVSKVTASRRAMITTGIIGVLIFGGIGAYVVDQSHAAVTTASLCGSAYYGPDRVQLKDKYGKAQPAFLAVMQPTSITQGLCAVNLSTTASDGVSKTMTVKIYGLVNNQKTMIATDTGTYQHYAGPLKYSFVDWCKKHPADNFGAYASMTYKGVFSTAEWVTSCCCYYTYQQPSLDESSGIIQQSELPTTSS